MGQGVGGQGGKQKQEQNEENNRRAVWCCLVRAKSHSKNQPMKKKDHANQPVKKHTHWQIMDVVEFVDHVKGVLLEAKDSDKKTLDPDQDKLQGTLVVHYLASLGAGMEEVLCIFVPVCFLFFLFLCLFFVDAECCCVCLSICFVVRCVLCLPFRPLLLTGACVRLHTHALTVALTRVTDG